MGLWAGIESFGSIAFIILSALSDDYTVFVPTTDPINSSEVRSQQLSVQIDRFLVLCAERQTSSRIRRAGLMYAI